MMVVRNINRVSVAVLIMLVASAGVVLTHLTYAASGSLTFSPSSGTVTVGNNLVVTVRENSGSEPVNTVEAFISYPSGLLDFVSASTTSPFSVAPPDSNSGGVLHITRGSYSGQTGDQVVSVVTFKAKASGTASLGFIAGTGKSAIFSANDNSNVLSNSPGGSYTLKKPATSTPTPTPSTPKPSTNPTPATTTNTNPKSKSVSVTPKSSKSSGVVVANNGAVAVSDSVTVQPATEQTEGVTKVEYYLDDKLVATQTKAPYKYSVDTKELKNGTYNLQTKTYYTNGSTKQTSQKLLVKNAAAKKSNAAGIGITVALLLIIVVAVAVILRKRPNIGQYAAATDQKVVTSDSSAPVQKPAATVTPATPAAPATAPTTVAPTAPAEAPHIVISAPSSTANNVPEPGTVIQHTVTPEEKDKV